MTGRSFDIDRRVKAIREFVEWYRRKYDIQGWNDNPMEPSGEMFGEFNALLFHSLVVTRFRRGAWLELRDGSSAHSEIATGVLQAIQTFLSRPPKGATWDEEAIAILRRVEDCL